MATPPTLVLLPEWGAGHLMSMLESCKRVLLSGGRAFSITLLVMRPPTAAATSEVEAHVRREAASGLDIRIHRLPAVEPPADAAGVEEFIARYIELHAPGVRDAVAGMSCPVAALVLDLFAAPMVDVAQDLGVPSYVFMSSTGAMLALMLHLPVLHEAVTVEFEEVEGGVVHVPGLPPIPHEWMPCPVVDKKSPNYTWFVRLGERFMDATGIIANTADELEPGPLAAIAEGRAVPGRPAPPVYPIGPVLSLGSSSSKKESSSGPPHACVAWLDAQPRASVVLLCFGSMGWFEAAQVVEICAALERCGAHRFLWVLRGPPGADTGAGAPDGSEHPTDADLDELLPEGFLERTAGRVLVWPTWAPQKEILAHAAVGGFVTHCGWNSVLESLWHGVPMAPWPLYAEQHLNAFELVADMGVAVPLKVDRKRDNFVEAAELERAVESLMGGGEEGRKAREKAAVMRDVCRKAVGKGGSSEAALQRLSEVLHEGALPKV
ncbi:anthocyanidin 3-O-glucosyltransferase 2 [Brachypodium distachyon]|uniref:anthocyanidin 3-O-glucosyltransferase 2 n=1 Tax=Brachypodium distachyon TaxID=15368 RepID=UPI0001C75980|nr:anthocyanidin 3-O-glucosyltransferase 2 [Brachypodium distachyon]|eukprot:XP_003563057.1 anthocyanidin 3-O-glucosyltransferase 2 [Brachypodium distachyon]